MSSASWDTFERYRQKGLDARRAGQWDSARIYLLEAARSMLALSKEAGGDELREGRRQMAARLLELAKDCEAANNQTRRPSAKRSADPSTETAEGEGGSSASQWIVKQRSGLRFDDVAGLDEVKEDIRLKMLYPLQHPDLAERFGVKPGGGVLLYGPPGTGKTMLAKATAGEIDATFFVISPADVLSKWVGEAEQNVKKLFDAAAAEERAIIFIDEIEALVPARKDEGSSVMQRVVPQILQGMEGFDKKTGRPVLFMGATNVPWQLDPAVLRPGRFDEKVYVPLPDEPARRKLLEIYLSKRPLSPGIDLSALAARLDGYSGADIKYICDRSATIPFLRSVASGEEGTITPQIIDDVLADAKRSVSSEMIQQFEKWTAA
jgi:transitional endoplasmic reticulum ATPase